MFAAGDRITDCHADETLEHGRCVPCPVCDMGQGLAQVRLPWLQGVTNIMNIGTWLRPYRCRADKEIKAQASTEGMFLTHVLLIHHC